MQNSQLQLIVAEQQQEARVWVDTSTAIQREQADFYAKTIQGHLIKVITGVRRCGKSFFSIQGLPLQSWVYLNFDDERFVGLSAKDLNQIYETLIQHKPDAKYFVFDEIQNIEHWDLFVNRLKRKGLNIIITGSNGKLLSKEISTHLTGRFVQIEMFPFSFQEYLAYHHCSNTFQTTEEVANVKNFFQSYIKEGGFPETLHLQNKNQYLRDLFDRIISRDILQRYALRSSTALKQLAILCVNSVSKEISYKKVSTSLGLGSMNTAQKYIQYLNDCYLFFELECFSYKTRERLTKPRKIYCIDTGMYNSLQSSLSDNRGQQLENLVFIELKRRQHEIFFYKTPNIEVDFLIIQNRKILELIQVCTNLQDEKTREREIKSLLMAAHDLKCEKLTVITLDEEETHNIQNLRIEVIPAWKWLLIPSQGQQFQA